MNKWNLQISFIVHIIFFLSIFDIYFKSPLISGVVPIENNVPPSAKRLILFVGDGLRADSFFEWQSRASNSSYLRHIIEKRGRWGISNTAVPTESRPGHVALIAGFYEDPSAIFKGWKDNLVEFDSVFNQSYATFGWGSPDILLMFKKESSTKRIFMNTYSTALQEFSGVDDSAARLSLWTLENFQEFLLHAKSNQSLSEVLNQEKIILFFHLLGIDTAGHAHKPYSFTYEENIRITDKIVNDAEKLIAEFYNYDNQSVFIYTSDHGMTDWGSHGEGSKSETELPYIVWGSGILEPKKVHEFHSPSEWNLNHLERYDINQIDVAPLMSVLLGIPIPVNSVGTVPVKILNLSAAEESSALFLNARQMLVQFIRKRKLVEDMTLSFFYKPFQELADGEDLKTLQRLEGQFQSGYYDSVIIGSRNLISSCSAGLSYYHNYYQNLLLICISSSYIGWICWLLLSISVSDTSKIVKYHTSRDRQRRLLYVLNFLFTVLLLLTVLLLSIQFLPYQYYLYCCLPLIIWWNVLRKVIISHFEFSFSYSGMFVLVAAIIGTELVVISFFERRILSMVMFFLMFWPLSYVKRKPFRTTFLLLWILSCISLMVFPFLPVIGGKPDNSFLVLGTFQWWLIIVLSKKFVSHILPAYSYHEATDFFTIFFVFFGIAIVNILYVTLTNSINGLAFFNQFISWMMLLSIPFSPVLSSRKLIPRLLNIYFSFGVVSLLFSVHYDSLFLPFFSFHLFLWFLAENMVIGFSRSNVSCHSVPHGGNLKSSDLRRAFLFFYYIILSFFGTGNIASINSFDPTWLRCFISVFAPFTMMSLILIKIIIPFIVTSCTFRAVNNLTQVPVDKIFFNVLIYCDIMGLNFLFLVKNIGSWLEIGSSVSHYIISQTIILFLVLLYVLSGYLINFKFKKIKSAFLGFRHDSSKRVE